MSGAATESSASIGRVGLRMRGCIEDHHARSLICINAVAGGSFDVEAGQAQTETKTCPGST